MRGKYTMLSLEVRANVGKYAAEHYTLKNCGKLQIIGSDTLLIPSNTLI